MNSRNIWTAAVVICCAGMIVLKWQLSNGAPTAPVVSARSVSDLQAVAPKSGPERQTEERLNQLAKQAEYLEKVQTAAQHTQESRKWVAQNAQNTWDAMLQANRAKYAALQQQLASSKTHTVHCTICNGLGELRCSLCTAHPGKCATCGGSGYDSQGNVCATCLGSGRCFLCSGTRKMNCIYCNDGMIDEHTPAPPASAPLN